MHAQFVLSARAQFARRWYCCSLNISRTTRFLQCPLYKVYTGKSRCVKSFAGQMWLPRVLRVRTRRPLLFVVSACLFGARQTVRSLLLLQLRDPSSRKKKPLSRPSCNFPLRAHWPVTCSGAYAHASWFQVYDMRACHAVSEVLYAGWMALSYNLYAVPR